MSAAGARAMRVEDEQTSRPEHDREAVLLHWERKLEREHKGGRFERSRRAPVESAAEPSVEAAVPEPVAPAPVFAAPERRTVVITGQPVGERRRSSVAARHIAAQPDRIAFWAFLLGLLLVAVAAGTAHA
jgi:hypothetical protein